MFAEATKNLQCLRRKETKAAILKSILKKPTLCYNLIHIYNNVLQTIPEFLILKEGRILHLTHEFNL